MKTGSSYLSERISSVFFMHTPSGHHFLDFIPAFKRGLYAARAAYPLYLKRNLGLLCLLTGSVFSPVASADDSQFPDLFSVGLAASTQHDSNLFLLPDNASPQSDRINMVRLGLQINKAYSLQRVELNLFLNRSQYSHFKYLDFTGTNFDAAWRWSLTPRLTGNVIASRTEALNSFADYRNFSVANVRTTQDRAANLEWAALASWHPVAGIYQTLVKNEQAFSAQDSTSLRGGEAGVRYVPSSGSSATLLVRKGRGTFLDRDLDPVALLDDQFDQNELVFRATWVATVKSTVNAEVTRLSLKNPHYSQRDYSGNVGYLTYNWTPTDKTKLAISAARNIYSNQDFTSSYIVTNSLTILPSWAISEKIAVDLNLVRKKGDYRGAVIPLSGGLREDTTNSWKLGLHWQPTRTVKLGVNIEQEKRNSNFSVFQYNTKRSDLNAQIVF